MESEKRFRSLIYNSSDIIRILDEEETILFDSPSSSRILGYPDGSLISSNTFDYIHPEDFERVKNAFLDVVYSRNTNIPTEYRIRRSDGKYIHVELIGQNLIRDPAINGIVVTTHPIENQKVAEMEIRKMADDHSIAYGELSLREEELREQYKRLKNQDRAFQQSEEMFRTVVHHSLDGIIIVNENGTILFTNNAALQITGASDASELFLKSSLTDFVAPETRDEVIRDFKELFDGKEGNFSHFKILTLNDEEKWVESIGKSIIFKNQSCILSSIRDVTDRKRDEEKLRKVTDELQQIFQNMINAFVIFESVFDEAGNYVSFRFGHFNETFARVSKMRYEDVKGKDVFEVWPETEQSWVEAFGRVAMTGIPYVFEMYHESTKGWYHCNVYRPTDSKDQVCVIFEDITERIMMNKALQKANSQLNLLNSITRHDINNEITTILLTLDALAECCLDPDSILHIGRIQKATNAIKTQILLTTVYKDLGSQDPQWLRLDLMLSRLSVRSDIACEYFIEDLEIYADSLLEKVFINLLDNSVRHGGDVTKIRIYSRESDESLILVWEDNGIGIAAPEKERIFESGFGRNTGLGLFLVKEILSLTDITIHETGDPGKGARFEIIVPKGGYRVR